MSKELRPALVMLLLFTAITGGVYTAIVTGLASLLFPRQATGSLIVRNDTVLGSDLIAQSFADPKYFWPRPSATSPFPCNADAGSGSNLATTNPDLLKAVQGRIAALHAADPTNSAPIPVELVTASASGLDPHISPAAAEYQLNRVANARHLAPDAVRNLVRRYTEQRDLGLLGESRINVLKLNLALDAMSIE
jgi:K+-transporting ATPase ATPase C chain